MKRWMLGVVITLVVAVCRAGTNDHWIRSVEIKVEELRDDGQQDYTVCISPAYTHECERLVFECIYHQEFPWTNAQGKRYTKTHEPVVFTYRRPGVKLVDDLDSYVSFRVPVSRERLEAAYGPTTFNKDYPITIPRIRITAEANGGTLWSFELGVPGKHTIADLSKAHGDAGVRGQEPDGKSPLSLSATGAK